jgi:hypothetical protein
MTDKVIDFIRGFSATSIEKEAKDVNLTLCYKKAFFQSKLDDSQVITRNRQITL